MQTSRGRGSRSSSAARSSTGSHRSRVPGRWPDSRGSRHAGAGVDGMTVDAPGHRVMPKVISSAVASRTTYLVLSRRRMSQYAPRAPAAIASSSAELSL